MGNPAIPEQPSQAVEAPPSKNGILTQVGGQHIASASLQLPAASQAEQDEPQRTVTVEVPDLGRVRITFQLNTYRHGKSRHWHWLAVRADRAE